MVLWFDGRTRRRAVGQFSPTETLNNLVDYVHAVGELFYLELLRNNIEIWQCKIDELHPGNISISAARTSLRWIADDLAPESTVGRNYNSTR